MGPVLYWKSRKTFFTVTKACLESTKRKHKIKMEKGGSHTVKKRKRKREIKLLFFPPNWSWCGKMFASIFIRAGTTNEAPCTDVFTLCIVRSVWAMVQNRKWIFFPTHTQTHTHTDTGLLFSIRKSICVFREFYFLIIMLHACEKNHEDVTKSHQHLDNFCDGE